MLRTGTSRRFLARRVWNSFLDELFPENRPYCKLCRKPMPADAMGGYETQDQMLGHGLDSICPFCLQEAEQVKLVNRLKSVRLRHMNPLERSSSHSSEPAIDIRNLPIVCALEYSGFVRTSIRHFKYDGLTALVPWFTSAMIEATETRRVFEHVDGIVHVPTSADRAKKRGYDQAHLLAYAIAKSTRISHIPVLFRSLDAGVFTQSQTAKSKADRSASLQGKFFCKQPELIFGKRILLVDDVVTTGTTMQTCADLILKSGAKSVIGLVIAYVR
jgi:ComF family protein